LNIGDQGAAALADAAVLSYSTAAEFITGGALVDSISGTDTDIVKASVGAALSATAATNFSRFSLGGAARNTNSEGLYLLTASGVTAASSLVFSAASASQIRGVDLSASTTGASTIDASASTSTASIWVLVHPK